MMQPKISLRFFIDPVVAWIQSSFNGMILSCEETSLRVETGFGITSIFLFKTCNSGNNSPEELHPQTKNSLKI